jgi:hypothetical protein
MKQNAAIRMLRGAPDPAYFLEDDVELNANFLEPLLKSYEILKVIRVSWPGIKKIVHRCLVASTTDWKVLFSSKFVLILVRGTDVS